MEKIEGFILAGGANSRMKRHKAFLELGGKSFLERAAVALHAVSQNLYVIGNSLPDNLFLPVVPDIYQISENKKRASIIGVHSALFNSKAEWTAILACDLPFASGELLARLATLGNISGKSDFDAVVPVQPDGKLQPLCAIYKTKVCLPQIKKMIAAGNFRLREIFSELNTRRVYFSEIADLPNAQNFFFNVNTPEDFCAAEEIENEFNQNN